MRYLSSTILRTLREIAASCSPGLNSSVPGKLIFALALLLQTSDPYLKALIQI
jgi:hypothetical protein